MKTNMTATTFTHVAKKKETTTVVLMMILTTFVLPMLLEVASERSMPSTPTEYKSDSDDEWTAEQRALPRKRYACVSCEHGH